ncbi:hypothetical protein [uncultured Sunxiuqinia sp.]|uniref:hypothetical protein n=1 Tax=uncultured Sunxiuqinia sp. TaxID=1573825 RepID=UPI002AA74AB7|nr:hypothetical protein [uncultured Sunxiuqinia sp.]
MQRIAVISADVINSSKFEESVFMQTMDVLEEPASNYLVKGAEPILSSRGDSFQLMTEETQQAFRKCIYLKSFFKQKEIGVKNKNANEAMDVRISLAVGQVTEVPKHIGKSMERPFVLSGRALDAMKKKKQTLIITTTNEEYNKEFELACAFLDQIFAGWTLAQAEVIYYLVQGYKQTEIAKILNLSQPSVSNRVHLANWTLIEKMNERYLDILEKI